MLNITLDINGYIVDEIHVLRLKPQRNLSMPEDADVECLYEVTVGQSQAPHLLVKHRYGNGGRALTQHVLSKLLAMKE